MKSLYACIALLLCTLVLGLTAWLAWQQTANIRVAQNKTATYLDLEKQRTAARTGLSHCEKELLKNSLILENAKATAVSHVAVQNLNILLALLGVLLLLWGLLLFILLKQRV
ncbi:hypothetical protein [Flavobacterium sp. ASW18X]|uniref:hypothetical protein n=1 Tax=Flavobacterium sp. ASW18X TaxID=2572595 RepID=UPI0010ADC880|nr:hypothetical protein [Flavobacterium sp. ASW18X]TKD63509.1 hypothetical protein FBT53_07995 [Flavobacterium sp. ASW18X]